VHPALIQPIWWWPTSKVCPATKFSTADDPRRRGFPLVDLRHSRNSRAVPLESNRAAIVSVTASQLHLTLRTGGNDTGARSYRGRRGAYLPPQIASVARPLRGDSDPTAPRFRPQMANPGRRCRVSPFPRSPYHGPFRVSFWALLTWLPGPRCARTPRSVPPCQTGGATRWARPAL